MRLIGLCGKSRTGKSLTADFLVQDWGFVRVSLASALKTMAAQDFALTFEQVYGKEKDIKDERYGVTPRQILIKMGQFYRSVNPNYWVQRLQETILSTRQAQLKTFVIDDIRFPNEVAWLKKYDGLLVRLERDEELKGKDIDDVSETALDKYTEWDIRVMPYENETPEHARSNAEHIHAILERKFPNR